MQVFRKYMNYIKDFLKILPGEYMMSFLSFLKCIVDEYDAMQRNTESNLKYWQKKHRTFVHQQNRE